MTEINGGADAIWTWDISPASERVLIEHPEMTEHYSSYEDELRRFFFLVRKGREPLAMISPRVDAIWHSLITFTPLYRSFCSTVIGFFVDHVPRTKVSPIPEKAIWNFLEQYRIAFGELPDCWFDGLATESVLSLKRGRVPEALLWSGWVPSSQLEEVLPRQLDQ